MPKNELRVFEDWYFKESDCRVVDELSAAQFHETCKSIRYAWEEAAFSTVMEETLMRYFHFHLQGISKFSDTLFRLAENDNFAFKQTELLKLINHIQIYYTAYFNFDTAAPFAYQKALAERIDQKIVITSQQLQEAKLPQDLKLILLGWIGNLTVLDQNIHYSFHTLLYFERIFMTITTLDLQQDDALGQLVSLLTQSNFNHLAFFTFRCNIILEELNALTSAPERLSSLQHHRAITVSTPEKKNLSYDPSWPSLKAMLMGWLEEEIMLVEIAVKKENDKSQATILPKLPLNLPVAHLAYLIRLFFEESVLSTPNLSSIFKFIAAHYQSKRQAIISSGSLSKEYYSTDQQTAARVRDLLQKMILRINRNFFPVLAAINVAARVYSNSR